MSQPTPAPRSRLRFVWLLVLIAFLAFMFGIWSQYRKDVIGVKTTAITLSTGTLLQGARGIAPFTLTDNQNKPFNNDSLKGQWTFAFFGFTSCSSICPTAMNDLAKTVTLINQEHKTPPRVAMISIDPERDTVSLVNAYVRGFNPNFMGLVGSEAQIKALTTELGVVYMKTQKQGAGANGSDDIDHSGAIMVFNPQGQLQAFFNTPHDAKAMAQDFIKLSKQ